MIEGDLYLALVLSSLAATAAGAGWFQGIPGRNRRKPLWVYSVGVAVAGYLLLLGFYGVLGAISFDGACPRIMQSPVKCVLSEFVLHILTIVSVGALPLSIALAAIFLVAARVSRQFPRGKS